MAHPWLSSANRSPHADARRARFNSPAPGEAIMFPGVSVDSRPETRHSRPSKFLAMAGIGTLYLATALSVATVIYPLDDEAVFANPAYNLITSGHFGTNIIEHYNTLPGIETRTYWFQPLFSLLLAGWLQVLPMDLFSQRLLSVAWGSVALAAWFVLCARLAGSAWCATIAVFALTFDYVFLSAAGSGRMDMMNAALSWLGLALYLQYRDISLPRAVFLACSACALNALTHPLGAILGVVNLLLIVALLDIPRLQPRLLLSAALPFVLVGSAWAAYIVQSPADFASQFLGNVHLTSLTGDTPRLSGLSNPPYALWRFAYNTVQDIYGPVDTALSAVSAKLLIPLAYLVAIAIAVSYPALRAQLLTRLLLLLCLIDFTLLALLNIRGKINYYIHVLPLFSILTVVVACRSHLLSRAVRCTAIACCAGVLLLNGARIAHSVHYNAYQTNYLPVQRVLRAVIPSDATVFAQSEWAFALGFARTLHDSLLGFRSGTRLHYLVVDRKQQYNMDIYSQAVPGFRQYSQRLLTDEYELVHQDSLVRIFRLRHHPFTARLMAQ